MSLNRIEMDCTRKCKSREHGAVVTSAITKRSVSDVALASFIRSTCHNFIQAFDHEGRTALHMAASRGRKALLEWLAKSSSEAFLNARDRESGYTALHRSIFYGQIHITVALSKIGVNFDIVDKDDFKAIDHAMLDRPAMYAYYATQPCDVYVWGSNTNYTLGTGTQQVKKLPDVLACFSRTNTYVKQVCLGKFHTAWLDSTGTVWVCGQGARFGVAANETVLRPAQLRLSEPCLQVALTVDSTVLLMQSGAILQFNISEVATSFPQPQSSKHSTTVIRPAGCKPLLRLPNTKGVVASRHHVATWEGATVYTWGTNVGQLGHSAGERIVMVPRKVVGTLTSKEETQIRLVAACDAATLVTTSRGDVYLLHQHLCKKIITKQINLEHACVEGKISESGTCSRITVVLMTNVGNLMLWQDDTNQLTRCIYGLDHPMVATYVTMIHDAILFTTRHGEGFVGAISRRNPAPTTISPKVKERADRKKSNSFQRFLDKNDCTQIKLRRIPNVHRAVKIVADADGLNFAVLQVQPNFGATSVPEISASEFQEHMEDLLADASEDDLLHDFVFKIGPRLYPAHAYIIANHSELLYKLYQEQLLLADPASAKPTVSLEHIHPAVFERILAYMYTGTCDVVQLGPCKLKVQKEELMGGQGQKEQINEGGIGVEDFNPSDISAFEVLHKQQKEKKSGKPQKTKTDPPVVRVNSHCDPVKLLQSTAKKLQVMKLHKLLDKYYYRNGRIYVKESASHSAPKPGWERSSCPELHDTTVQSRDGALIPTHKCVLAARLEYFNRMFMHSWTESQSKSQILLPINEAILRPVIDFLYTDDCPSVTSSDSIDFLTNLLIVSDQLFVSRLREMCEVALANLITLKNCTEMCQLAHTYNAEQLKKCCLQFISLNLCTFIENRSLDVLNDSLLEELTEYYTKFIPIMSSRIITPFSTAPDDETVNVSEKENPTNLDNTFEVMMKEEPVEVPKKKSKSSKKIEYTKNEKARMRYESVSSVTLDESTKADSGDITLSLRNLQLDGREQSPVEKKEQWIKLPLHSEKQQKIIQARLKATLKKSDSETLEGFTKMGKHASSSPPQSVLFESSSPKASSQVLPPDFATNFDSPRSPQGSIYINHVVGIKLSQKQRKKLSLGGRDQGGWDDVLGKPVANEPSTSTPRNPWKVVEPPTQIVTPTKRSDPDFNEILADQRKQKDNFSKMMTKSLVMTQLEDKAIEELTKFYNIEEVDDEHISVRRIDIDMVNAATPQWIHSNSLPK